MRRRFAFRLPHLTLATFCVASAVAVPVGAKGLEIAARDEILAGTRSCVASVGPAGLNQDRLTADGWSKGSMSSKNGKAIDTGLVFYGKGHLVLLSAPPKPGKLQLCTLMARIVSVGAFSDLQATFASTYGAPFKDDGKGEQFFQAPDHRFINLASTGSNDRPSVRVAVGYVSQESK